MYVCIFILIFLYDDENNNLNHCSSSGRNFDNMNSGDLDDLETMSSGDTTSEEDNNNTRKEQETRQNNYGLQKMPSYEFKFAQSKKNRYKFFY